MANEYLKKVVYLSQQQWYDLKNSNSLDDSVIYTTPTDNNGGVIGEQGPIGPQGAQGIQGPKGDKGETALSIKVGEVTTLSSSQPATVQNVGTDTDLIIDFGIPRGLKGDTGSGGGGGALVLRTYAELATLKSTATLQPGMQYLLTDYATKYQQPGSLKLKIGSYDLVGITPEQITEMTEPLVLRAISPTDFDVICSSPKYPNDIIYYDFDSNVCEDEITPRNGFILRRHWTKNNVNAPHDWRTMKWARFEVDTTKISVYTDGMAVEKGKFYLKKTSWGDDVVKCVKSGTPSSGEFYSYFAYYYIILYDDAYGLKADKAAISESFTFDNVSIENVKNVYVGNPGNVGVFPDDYYPVFLAKKLLNSILGGYSDGGSVQNIKCGDGFCDNTFRVMDSNNTFGNNCHGNYSNESFCFNTIGDNIYSNIICDIFSKNTIIGVFAENYFGYGGGIGYFTKNNIFSGIFKGNIIGGGLGGSWTACRVMGIVINNVFSGSADACFMGVFEGCINTADFDRSIFYGRALNCKFTKEQLRIHSFASYLDEFDTSKLPTLPSYTTITIEDAVSGAVYSYIDATNKRIYAKLPT